MKTEDTSRQFWDQHYRTLQRPPSGTPSAKLVEYVSTLPPGRALDLGCSRGDDIIWLARRGWKATGVDVSAVAIEIASGRAQEAGVGASTHFEVHDLAMSFPEGGFDLVTALFFQSPLQFPRYEVLGRAASHVNPDGLLLIVEHASAAPWSWSPNDTFPTAEKSFADLCLTSDDWDRIFVGAVERIANGPDGQTAIVTDNVIALRRRLQA